MNFASFTFKVNDGELDSPPPYTMTIDVTPLPSHCNPSDPLELWCADLTVASFMLSGSSTAYLGYNNFETPVGALTETQFTYSGVPYTVDFFAYSTEVLTFGYQPSGLIVLRNNPRFTLRIGTTDFSFEEITTTTESSLDWDSSLLSWSASDTVPVKFLRSRPTAADGTVTTEADTDYSFVAADFTLAIAQDVPKIVTLPGRGALKLDSVPVSAGDSIPQARIDAGDFTYTPPRGEVGEDMSWFTFKVNDGELDSARAYTMTIHVDNKLAGNLEQTPDGTAISLPDGSYNAYAQRFRTGSSAQELGEVELAITVPSGTTPKVSIWYGRTNRNGN